MGSDDSTMNSEVTQGRKRFMSLLSLFTFVLLVAAAEAPDWIKGGLELAADGGGGSGNALHWHVDLREVGIENNLIDIYGRDKANVVYARADYMNRLQAQSVFPGCTRGVADPGTTNPNLWCGLSVSNFNPKMDATYTLLIISSVLSFLAWILINALVKGNIAVLSWQHSFRAIGALMAASCFFCFIGVVNFAGANIKTSFCSVFDPPNGDTSFSATSYCSYSDVRI